jgi:hypothetical protein
MKRFTKRYALVYLFCILCLINVGATLFGVTRHAILIQNPGYICDYFTNFDNISKSDGFSIHGFWITLSAVPLSVYLIFVEPFRLRVH